MKKQFLVTVEGKEQLVKGIASDLMQDYNRDYMACTMTCAELEPDRTEEFNRIMTTLEMEAETLNAEPIC